MFYYIFFSSTYRASMSHPILFHFSLSLYHSIHLSHSTYFYNVHMSPCLSPYPIASTCHSLHTATSFLSRTNIILLIITSFYYVQNYLFHWYAFTSRIDITLPITVFYHVQTPSNQLSPTFETCNY